MIDIRRHITELVNAGIVSESNISGCSENEIRQVLRAQEADNLPKLYHDFLRTMGKNPSWLMPGEAWTLEDLLIIKEDAREMLLENNADTKILNGSVLFLEHPSYAFYYFPSEQVSNDDPQVWEWSEAYGTSPRKIWDLFSEFLYCRIDSFQANRAHRIG